MRTGAKLIAIGIACGAAAAALPWTIGSPDVRRTLVDELGQVTGGTAVIGGPITLKLLPRPRLQVNELSLAKQDGALLVDVPVFKAEFDIASLFRGQWHLSSATLVAPTVTLNLDRLRATYRDSPGAGLVEAAPWPLKLHLRGALLRTLSSEAATDFLATDVDVTAALAGRDDPLVFSGSATLRGTSGHFAGSLERPARLFDPEGSVASLQIDSPLFTFAATGLLSGGSQQQFTGHLAGSTPALPRLLRTLDGFPIAVGAHRAQLSGDIVAKPHDVSLSNVALKLDRGQFEGTLALRRTGDRDLIQGTLATDMLDVDALLGDAANRHALEEVYRRRLDAGSFRTDVDMRVSASASRVGRLHLDDTAVAALLRDGRLEVTIDEARGYGGTLKARAIANVDRAGVETQADVSLTRVDLGRLSQALVGQERVSGQITGTAALTGRGFSLREVVAALGGKGEVAIDHGQLMGLSLGQALRRLGRKLPIDVDPQGQPTAFDKALWDFSVENGVLKIPEGRLTAPGLQMKFDSRTDLPDGRIDVHAVAAQTDAEGTPVQGGSRLPFDLTGSWDRPFVLVQRAGREMPALGMPIFGSSPALP